MNISVPCVVILHF